MGEKTEKATPKKLQDARKKGQVAKAQDLPGAFTFITSVSVILFLASSLYNQLSGFIVGTFQTVNNPELDQAIVSLFYKSIEVIFIASMPILVIVAFVGVLVTFLTVGPVFSTEVFKFDPKKFDPISNLKAKFKLKTLVELLKSHIKVFVAAYLIYLVMYKSIPVLIQTVAMPITGALAIFNLFLVEVIVKVGLFFIVVAVCDFAYQKMAFAKEMKMEKFEIKQEYKNSEGDPHIKSKRRQIAQEIAYQEGPAGGVKKAQAVVTNPKHLAIAIGFDKEVDPAPYILAMGEDNLAALIIKTAMDYNVPVLRNIPLAHTLWDEGELYSYVPEESYEALAEVLRWVASLTEE
ncbi:MAG: type III secretion system export apparatus subunit SctU [Chlamydiales bacterium]